MLKFDFTGGTSSKESASQSRRYRRYGFHTRFRKLPWRRAWQPTPGYLPNPGMETVSLMSPALAEGSLMPPGKPRMNGKKGLSESYSCLVVSDSL